jgi:hypothetical protein
MAKGVVFDREMGKMGGTGLPRDGEIRSENVRVFGWAKSKGRIKKMGGIRYGIGSDESHYSQEA